MIEFIHKVGRVTVMLKVLENDINIVLENCHKSFKNMTLGQSGGGHILDGINPVFALVNNDIKDNEV